MNLETGIDSRLWQSLRSSWDARKYTSAILDAIHLLTDVIRERAGLEGDGVALIGSAFGGAAPKLKVNRLQTESDQNVQRGTEAMLRGIYQAIRNPRSHDAFQDNERDATALILLVDYLLRVVDQSGSPFSLVTLVERVLDPAFVSNPRYANLLVDEIPARKRLAVCQEVFFKRAEADQEKVKHFFAAILAKMSEDDVLQFCNIVSEVLRETHEHDTIRFVLSVFPENIWPRLSEVARIRIENKLITDIQEGKWNRRRQQCLSGALGTWITNIIPSLTLADEFWIAIYRNLESLDADRQDYVFNFFGGYFDTCLPTPPTRLVRCVVKGLKAGDKRFKDLADRWTDEGFYADRPEDHPWRKPFLTALAEFTDGQLTAEVIPFEDGADSIPF